jgi:hypothetical protein
MIPGPPPEITEKPAADKRRAIVLGHLVIGMLGRHARAAEDGDGRLDGLQPLGGGDELCDNLEHPPRFARRRLRALQHLGVRGFGTFGEVMAI